MSHPHNPTVGSCARLAVALTLLVCCYGAAGARAQSGRKAQKPLGLPTEQPKPGDSADKPAESKKPDALYTFVVIKDDSLGIGYETLAREGVSRAFVERLRQTGSSVEVKDGGKGRRQEARERAKKEDVAYVVFFQMEETNMPDPTNMNTGGLVLRTYVYTPKTGDLKYTDTIFQRPYQDSARVGGVRVPVPTRRAERYPSQHQLEQAARDAADRLLSRFQITPPPQQ